MQNKRQRLSKMKVVCFDVSTFAFFQLLVEERQKRNGRSRCLE